MKAFYYISILLGPEISLRMGDDRVLRLHSRKKVKAFVKQKRRRIEGQNFIQYDV